MSEIVNNIICTPGIKRRLVIKSVFYLLQIHSNIIVIVRYARTIHFYRLPASTITWKRHYLFRYRYYRDLHLMALNTIRILQNKDFGNKNISIYILYKKIIFGTRFVQTEFKYKQKSYV